MGCLTLLVLLATGCQVRTSVQIDVADDGSGEVAVEATFDQAAIDQLGGVDNLRAAVQVDDLVEAGWRVEGPEPAPDRDPDAAQGAGEPGTTTGGTGAPGSSSPAPDASPTVTGDGGETSAGPQVLRVAKSFAHPDELGALIEELSGPGGPLRDFHLRRQHEFVRSQWQLSGTIDLSGGLEAFGDAELAALLGGEPLGDDAAALIARYGGTVDDAFPIEIVVGLPGELSSNAPELRGNKAVWKPSLARAEMVALVAGGDHFRLSTLVAVGLAALATLVLLVVLGLRSWRRRRSARRGDVEVDPESTVVPVVSEPAKVEPGFGAVPVTAPAAVGESISPPEPEPEPESESQPESQPESPASAGVVSIDALPPTAMGRRERLDRRRRRRWWRRSST